MSSDFELHKRKRQRDRPPWSCNALNDIKNCHMYRSDRKGATIHSLQTHSAPMTALVLWNLVVRGVVLYALKPLHLFQKTKKIYSIIGIYKRTEHLWQLMYFEFRSCSVLYCMRSVLCMWPKEENIPSHSVQTRSAPMAALVFSISVFRGAVWCAPNAHSKKQKKYILRIIFKRTVHLWQLSYFRFRFFSVLYRACWTLFLRPTKKENIPYALFRNSQRTYDSSCILDSGPARGCIVCAEGAVHVPKQENTSYVFFTKAQRTYGRSCISHFNLARRCVCALYALYALKQRKYDMIRIVLHYCVLFSVFLSASPPQPNGLLYYILRSIYIHRFCFCATSGACCWTRSRAIGS